MKQLWDGNIDDNLEVEIVITRLDREITKKKKYFYTFTYILINKKQNKFSINFWNVSRKAPYILTKH